MNKTLSTILIVLAVLVVAGGLFFAGTMFVRGGLYGTGFMMSGYGPNSGSDFGPGGGIGPGMMGNRGGGYGMGPGMMRGYGWNNGNSATVKALTVDQAKQAAEKTLQSLNLTGLEIGEVMVFDNNAYVVVKETSTGMGAFELLVDPVSQVAYPEFGPNMMWNLKYGGMMHTDGGMMGAGAGLGIWNTQNTTPADVSADMPVTQEQAIKDAQTFLDKNVAGATAATDPVKFYGYYTLDFTKDGKVAGMLSVNGYNGQIFVHTWHGTFVEESQ
jgi:hypothetical protein